MSLSIQYKLSILDHEVDLVISDDVQDTDINLDYDFGYCNVAHSQIWVNSRLADSKTTE